MVFPLVIRIEARFSVELKALLINLSNIAASHGHTLPNRKHSGRDSILRDLRDLNQYGSERGFKI